MNHKIIKIISGVAIILAIGVGIFIATKNPIDKKTTSIVTSSFIGYDFVRAVTNDVSNISMLLRPGAETHDYEPTPEDIIGIKNADLFIYVGGESDEWVKELLRNNGISEENTMRLMDLVELKEEELSEGMEKHSSEHVHQDEYRHDEKEIEYDEHIWTSPLNAIKLVNKIKDKLSNIYPENESQYAKNASIYVTRLANIDQSFREVVLKGNKKELIFGDRFPFRYFVDEYNLNYYAAFPGCSEQTEASSKTVAFLIDKVKMDDIRVILKIELTSDKLASTIANESGAKVMELHAAHNISQKDFDSGLTYADIMENNLKVLEEALK